MGGAHVEHAVHARDAGRVEVHRPVEVRCALPSQTEGMRCVGARCGTGDAKTVGLIREGSVQEWVVIVGGECSRRVRGGFQVEASSAPKT